MTIDPIALYGAVVATGLLLWSVLRDWPRIIVTVEFQGGFSNDESVIYYMNISIINKGRRAIRIDALGFTYMDGGTLSFSPSFVNVERNLGPQTKAFLQMDMDWVREITSNKRCKFFWVKDETGKAYKRRLPKYVFG